MYPSDIVEFKDNYFILITSIDSNYDGYFTSINKFDNSGELINQIDLDTLSIFQKFTFLNDSEFVLIGSVFNFETDSFDLWFLKFDNNLNIITDKKYHCIPSSLVDIVTIMKNETIYSCSYFSYFYNFFEYLVSFNTEGDTIQTKKDQLIGNDCFNVCDIKFNPNNNLDIYRICFYPSDYNQIQHVDTNFNTLSIDTFVGQDMINNRHTAIQFSDSTYLFSSNYTGFEPPSTFIYDIGISLVLYPDSFLNIYHFGNNNKNEQIATYRSIDYVSKNYIYIGATSNYEIHYQNQPSYIFVFSLDSNFNIKKQLFLGGDLFYLTEAIKATNDNGVIVVGSCRDIYGDLYNLFILKLDSSLVINDIPLPGDSTSFITVYPNPGNDILLIDYKSNNQYTTLIKMFNIEGQLLFTNQLFSGVNEINTSFLKNGLYFYTIENEKQLLNGKWIKMSKE